MNWYVTLFMLYAFGAAWAAASHGANPQVPTDRHFRDSVVVSGACHSAGMIEQRHDERGI